jgi:hypothetical protein
VEVVAVGDAYPIGGDGGDDDSIIPLDMIDEWRRGTDPKGPPEAGRAVDGFGALFWPRLNKNEASRLLSVKEREPTEWWSLVRTNHNNLFNNGSTHNKANKSYGGTDIIIQLSHFSLLRPK